MTDPALLTRRLLLAAGGSLVATGATHAADAEPFFERTHLPLGLQLYTVGAQATKDPDGTLQTLAKIGYRTVELAGYLGLTPAALRAALDKAGLKCPSAHIQPKGTPTGANLSGDLNLLASDMRTIGADTVIMPILYIPDRFMATPPAGVDRLTALVNGLTADDWTFNADFLNTKGKALKELGLKLGYHNHNMEFSPVGGSTGLEILLHNTDPELVHFEMDVGWVVAGGGDPAALLAQHPGRFTAMHVKDVKAGTKTNYIAQQDPSEVGGGIIDWKHLLPKAYKAGVRRFFVEQEPPFARPPLESVKMSFDYLSTLVTKG